MAKKIIKNVDDSINDTAPETNTGENPDLDNMEEKLIASGKDPTEVASMKRSIINRRKMTKAMKAKIVADRWINEGVE
jgi:hypothetical protein